MQHTFEIERFLAEALAEDIGSGDVTSLATIPAETQASFVMRAREELVVAGLGFLPALFHLIDPAVQVQLLTEDGEKVPAGTQLATLKGNARALLAGERTALNLVQHLSGVATLTRRYVDAVAGTSARIVDTRKTIPGMRWLQKYAVTCGGGHNHRMGLYDAILIKDNHIAVAGGVTHAIQAARAASSLPLEVEVDTLAQLEQALAARADTILLDNMDNTNLQQAVAKAKGRAVTEASGNVNLQTVRAIAETGVDIISIGKLTHSVQAVDIGLDAA